MNTIKPANRVCAVIPFFNEQKTIKNVVRKTLNYVNEVIAVNDGSKDSSMEELTGIERLTIINLKMNTGKGNALRIGMDHSFMCNYDITVTIDADLQHDPAYIPSFLSVMDDYDIIIGNRLTDLKSMPYHRRLSNKVTSALLSRKLNVKVKDSQCGFRAYRTKILPSIQTHTRGFEAESEIIVNAVRNNFKIGFVSIPAIYGDEKSKMRSVQATIGFIKVLLS